MSTEHPNKHIDPLVAINALSTMADNAMNNEAAAQLQTQTMHEAATLPEFHLDDSDLMPEEIIGEVKEPVTIEEPLPEVAIDDPLLRKTVGVDSAAGLSEETATATVITASENGGWQVTNPNVLADLIIANGNNVMVELVPPADAVPVSSGPFPIDSTSVQPPPEVDPRFVDHLHLAGVGTGVTTAGDFIELASSTNGIMDEATEEEGDKADEPVVEPKPLYMATVSNPNVTRATRTSFATPDDNVLPTGALPGLDFADALNATENAELADDFEPTDDWYSAASRTGGMSFKNNGLTPVQHREGSNWQQTLRYGEKHIGVALPKFKAGDGIKLSGIKAINACNSLLGLGSNIRIPLLHTGIQLLVESPEEGGMLLLERAIASTKNEYGVNTHGLVYTTSQGFLDMAVGEYIVKNVIESTMLGADADTLYDTILITDLPHMCINTAASMYTAGYPYEIPCTANVGKCSNVAKQTVLLHKLNWIDNTPFTDIQKEFIANIAVDRTADEILSYQLSFGETADNVLSLKDGAVKVYWAVPTLRKHAEATKAYMAELSLLADEAIGKRDDDALEENEQLIRAEYPVPEEMTAEQAAEMTVRLRKMAFRFKKLIDDRTAFINRKLAVAALREYSAWVGKIEMVSKDGVNVIDDPETIRKLLSRWSTYDGIVTKFIAAVNLFINNSTRSLVATPAFVCPACQQLNVNKDENAAHPHLIPLNAPYTFFTLGVLRITQAQHEAD